MNSPVPSNELIDHFKTIYATIELLDERLEEYEARLSRLEAQHNAPLLTEDK